MTLAAVSLDDKYAAWSGEVYMTGTQALVRLPMMQHLRDKTAGLDTACMISTAARRSATSTGRSGRRSGSSRRTACTSSPA